MALKVEVCLFTGHRLGKAFNIQAQTSLCIAQANLKARPGHWAWAQTLSNSRRNSSNNSEFDWSPTSEQSMPRILFSNIDSKNSLWSPSLLFLVDQNNPSLALTRSLLSWFSFWGFEHLIIENLTPLWIQRLILPSEIMDCWRSILCWLKRFSQLSVHFKLLSIQETY